MDDRRAIAITDYAQAMRLLFERNEGAFETVDGITVSGALDDIEDPINDPLGIGHFVLKGDDGRLIAIYEDEFKGMVEDDGIASDHLAYVQRRQYRARFPKIKARGTNVYMTSIG